MNYMFLYLCTLLTSTYVLWLKKKNLIPKEELNEMIIWFNNHANELPKEMQINKAAFTPDLKLTIESCIMQAKQNLGNYKMGGPFLILKQIRANIENSK